VNGGGSAYEVLVAGSEAVRFEVAFFRYLGLHELANGDIPAMLTSTPEGDFTRVKVVLWSRAAIEGFARSWRGHRLD